MKVIISSSLGRSSTMRHVAIGALLATASCTLPQSGPSLSRFVQAGKTGTINLIEATSAEMIASRDPDHVQFPLAWRVAKPEEYDRIGPGDQLRITISERDGLGMFPTDQSGQAALDAVVVDAGGNVQLPYMWSVHLGGLSLGEAHNLLLRRVNRLALSSDVQLSFVERHSQLVSVEGDVTKSGTMQLSRETGRLISLLSSAAPTTGDIEQVVVTVQRGAESASLRLSDIYDQLEENIALRPGDNVIVRNKLDMVSVLGAAGFQSRIKLTKRNYSVIDAVSDARGLDGDAANPAAVYLLRLADIATLGQGVPKVYHFDFRNPAQLAVASGFTVHNGDAIFISTAPFTQVQKVLSALSGVLNTARSASVVAL